MSRDVEGLLARVEASAGPDRELDHWLHGLLMTVPDENGHRGQYKTLDEWVNASIQFRWAAPHFTASVDAALALVERMLPTGPAFSLDHAVAVWTCEFHWFINPPWHVRADQPTAPLAILAALLRALAPYSSESET